MTQRSFSAWTLIISLFALPVAAGSQDLCDGIRFREFIFDDFNVTGNLVYGENLNYDGSSEELTLDVYEPVGDEATLRPLVIFAHGGFFISGSKDGADVVPACGDLARMGYVTASINYRLGFPLGGSLEQNMTEAAMRGVHDMKAAIRYFRKTVAEDGNPYGIDETEIYIAGVSAGGYITLHAAYLDEDSEVPDYVDFSNPGLTGGLEGESGNAGYSSSFNAIINIAGAIGDTAWIEPNDIPACLFHGDEDTTVPYGTDMQYVFGVVQVTVVNGSASIAEAMELNGTSHCFETYEGENHVPHVSQEAYYDTTLSIITNFLSHHICGIDLDCSYRELSTGISEENIAAQVSVYPNPAADRVIISHAEHTPAMVMVRDYTGKLIRSETITAGGTLILDELVTGTYLIDVVTDHGRVVQPLVIMR